MDLNTIHNYILTNLDNQYDKSVGYPSYDFTRAFASGIYWLDARTEAAWNLLDVNTMEGTFLDVWCWQRKGLTRKRGSLAQATLKATLSTTPVSLSNGTVFATPEGLQFFTTGDYTLTDSDRTFTVTAMFTGEEYNVESGKITIIPVQVPGIVSVTNESPATGGDDGEDDDEFRNRYYLAVENGANGTNVGSYVDWACEVPGVHYAKCLPATPTAGQCKVLIVDEHGNPATSLVTAVQAKIDPHQNGDGEGLAPMGCICTVAAPETVAVGITINSFSGAVSQSDIENAIWDYAADEALKSSIFSYPKLLSYLFKRLEGLQDIDILFNGVRDSVQVGENKVARIYIGPIWITSQPQDVTTPAGVNVRFSVAASGAGPLTYKWYLSTNGGSTWQASSTSGYNTNTITVTAIAARNGYKYKCKLTTGEYELYSDVATLHVEV